MRHTVKLPKLSNADSESVVEGWLVAIGSVVEVGQPLLSLETDKAVVELPSPISGTIVEFLVSNSEEISTGTRLCVIEDNDG